MKLRMGFVTNSSSSSFILINIQSKKMIEIANKYPTIFECDEDEPWANNLFTDGDTLTYHEDEAYLEIPDSPLSALRCLIHAIDSRYAAYEEDDDSETLEEDDDEELSERSLFAKELLLNQHELADDIELAEVMNNSCGYQGDDESRYYKSSYSESRLKEIYEAIAETKNCSVDEITDEDFADYVSPKMSISEEGYRYNKKTGESKTTSDYYLQ